MTEPVASIRVDLLPAEDEPFLYTINVHSHGEITRAMAIEILRAAADLFELGGGTEIGQEEP